MERRTIHFLWLGGGKGRARTRQEENPSASLCLSRVGVHRPPARPIDCRRRYDSGPSEMTTMMMMMMRLPSAVRPNSIAVEVTRTKWSTTNTNQGRARPERGPHLSSDAAQPFADRNLFCAANELEPFTRSEAVRRSRRSRIELRKDRGDRTEQATALSQCLRPTMHSPPVAMTKGTPPENYKYAGKKKTTACVQQQRSRRMGWRGAAWQSRPSPPECRGASKGLTFVRIGGNDANHRLPILPPEI
jgi:hypothetical protein